MFALIGLVLLIHPLSRWLYINTFTRKGKLRQATLMGLEPTTPGSTVRYSVQLSYRVIHPLYYIYRHLQGVSFRLYVVAMKGFTSSGGAAPGGFCQPQKVENRRRGKSPPPAHERDLLIIAVVVVAAPLFLKRGTTQRCFDSLQHKSNRAEG